MNNAFGDKVDEKLSQLLNEDPKFFMVAATKDHEQNYTSYVFRSYLSPFKDGKSPYLGCTKEEDFDCTVKQVLRATSAAPFYFEPVKISIHKII
jgi:predicted patatin/cPLA2 family phospholipase